MKVVGRARRVTTIAAAGVLALAGVGTGAGAAPQDGGTEVALTYTCQLASGAQPVAVRITATFPESGTVGVAITPADATVTATLPEAVRTELTALGAATVAGTAELNTAIAQNGTVVDGSWPDLAAPSVAVAEPGELVLAATGAVPAVTVDKPGAVTFTAGELALELVARKADGSATEPAILPLACALNPEQDAALATVEVPDPDEGLPPSKPPLPGQPQGEAPGGIQVGSDPTAPGGPKASAGEIPPECGDIPPINNRLTTCAYLTGYANVAKLNASVLIEPTLTNIALGNVRVQMPWLYQENLGELAIPEGRFPPLTGSFAVFGFMPIQAKLELTQVGDIQINTRGMGLPPFTYLIFSNAKLAVRVHDVKINGVPLDVGPNCRTAEPLDVRLEGGTPDYTDIRLGGPLDGVVDIPPFTGCGVGEDLDPLFTGTVSGPGNYSKVTQGKLCAPKDPSHSYCPPVVPLLPPPGDY